MPAKNPNEVRGSEPDTNAAKAPPDATGEWRDHEHVAEPARGRAAQKKGKQPPAVGDDDVLEKAVRDEGGDHPPGNDASRNAGEKDAFATKLGFESFLALFENSAPVASDDERTWRVAALPDGKWAVWNEQELETGQRFTSREDAVGSVSGGEALA